MVLSKEILNAIEEIKHETSKQNPWKQGCLINKISMQQVEAERNGKKSIRNGQDC